MKTSDAEDTEPSSLVLIGQVSFSPNPIIVCAQVLEKLYVHALDLVRYQLPQNSGIIQ